VTRRQAPSEWIAAGEAVAILGVSPATLRRWADAGHLSCFTTPGGHRRFDRSTVMALAGGNPSNEEQVVRALRDYLRTAEDGRSRREVAAARRLLAALQADSPA
jgi:excisionase family DNA binding protein